MSNPNPVMQALMLARADDRLRQLRYEPPCSWTKEAKAAFLHLPPPIQIYYVAREKDRDRAVKGAQREAAGCRKQLAEAEATIADLKAKLEAKDVCPASTDAIAPHQPKEIGHGTEQNTLA